MDPSWLRSLLQNRQSLICNLSDVFGINKMITFNYSHIEVLHNGEYLNFKDPDVNDEEATDLEKKYITASNNGISYQKWENVIKELPAGSDAYLELVRPKYNGTLIGLSSIDEQVIKIIKEQLPGCQIKLNLSYYFDNDDKLIWTSSSKVTLTEFMEHYLVPLSGNLQLQAGDQLGQHEYFKGFNIYSPEREENSEYFYLSVESSSLILQAGCKSSEYKTLITNLVKDIPNLYDINEVINDLNNDNSIYCYTDPNKDEEIDYELLLSHLEKINNYLNNLTLKMCIHVSIDL